MMILNLKELEYSLTLRKSRNTNRNQNSKKYSEFWSFGPEIKLSHKLTTQELNQSDTGTLT